MLTTKMTLLGGEGFEDYLSLITVTVLHKDKQLFSKNTHILMFVESSFFYSIRMWFKFGGKGGGIFD